MATTSIEQHPDLVAVRSRYELAAEALPAHVADGLGFLAGLYVAIAPWVVGFDQFTRLTVSNLVIGIALAVLAFSYASAFGRTHSMAWVTPLLGVWIVISPWVVLRGLQTTSIVVNNVIAGAVVVLLGLAIAATGVGGMTRSRPIR